MVQEQLRIPMYFEFGGENLRNKITADLCAPEQANEWFKAHHYLH